MSRVGGRAGESFLSPTMQREAIGQWATLRGVEIVSWHEDLDVTGGKLTRPGLDAAMREIRTKASDGIAVARLDRLSRAGVADALRLVAEIHEHGGELAAVDLGIDPTTPFGEFGLTIMLALARMQRRQTAATWKDSRRRAVARGVHIASRTPTGYNVAPDGRLKPSSSAEAIRRLFHAAARGASWRELGALMEGVPSPYGASRWTGRSLTHVLSNRVYLGEARSGEFRQANAHEALVSPEAWQAAQRQPGERSRSGQSLLAGLLRCAGCRYVMRPDTMKDRKGDRVRSYRCRGTRPHGDCPARAAVLGSVVEPWVVEEMFREVGEVRLRAVNVGRDLADAEKGVSAAIIDRDEYRDSEVISVIGTEAYLDGLKVRQERVERAEVVARDLRTRAGVVELGGEGDLRSAWEKMDVGERRHVLSGAIDAVFVRATGRKNIPITKRGKILFRGQAPDDLPGPGRRLGAIRSFDF